MGQDHCRQAVKELSVKGGWKAYDPAVPPRTDRLEILLYLPSLGGGGAERLFAQLASALVERGHGVTLVVDTPATENADHLDARVRVVQFDRDHARATLRLAGLLRTQKPDVSLSALGGQNLKHFVAAFLAGRLRHAAQSCHGFYEGEPKLLSRLSFLLTALTSRLMARTVAVSDALRDDLLARFHASPKRTVRIHNGVASSDAHGPRVPAEPPIVLACGRLTPDKNYPLLLRAFAEMRGRNSRLVILGEGSERTSIEAEVARSGLADRVHMPGYADPAPYYARASSFAITSDREAFGLVVVEALAAGLPVVTTPSGGPPEVLGSLGTVVPKGDVLALAAALDAAVADTSDGEARRARAKIFSMTRCADAYETMFSEIVRQASPLSPPEGRGLG